MVATAFPPTFGGDFAAVLADGVYIGGGVLLVILIIVLFLLFFRR